MWNELSAAGELFGISDSIFMDRCIDIHKYLGTEVRNLIKTHVRPLPSLPRRMYPNELLLLAY